MEQQYLDLLSNVLVNGETRTDRTGVGTKSIFGAMTRYDLSRSFPAITTKKLAFKACVSELLWFLEGSGDERRLAEILYGTRDQSKKTIWTDNVNADYWKPKAKFEGDAGRPYGVQWRSWLRPDGTTLDQIKELITNLKNNPTSRRHLVITYNPGEVEQMVLPPCHVMFQMYVTGDNKLNCMMTQRSSDLPLGAPFNIASYSLLTCMIAQICGYTPGEFVYSIGDAHIYLNQIDGIKEQLTRAPLTPPQLWLNPNIKDIDKFTMDDIKLIDYVSHPPINFPMAV